MARLIDADAFIAEHCADCKYANVNGICTKEAPLCGSVQIVTELPTIDAVEVVRCKDCNHRYNGKDCTHPLLLSYSWGAIRNVKDNDFCSYGERKDNG